MQAIFAKPGGQVIVQGEREIAEAIGVLDPGYPFASTKNSIL
jgi:hypothetical protein